MLILFRALDGQHQFLHAANRCTFNARHEEEELLLLGQRELTDDVLYRHPHHSSDVTHSHTVIFQHQKRDVPKTIGSPGGHR